MTHASLYKNHSKKVSHAENQQERLIMIGWMIGFVDGEGCFSINFIKQPNRIEKDRIRKGYKTGYQISHEFAITQGESSLESLEKIKDFFKVGNIYVNKRYDNQKENFGTFAVCMNEIGKGAHLTLKGFVRIAKRTENMNHKKDRSQIIKILRNQTSASRRR